jgi:hypothetical protein
VNCRISSSFLNPSDDSIKFTFSCGYSCKMDSMSRSPVEHAWRDHDEAHELEEKAEAARQADAEACKL